MVVPLDIPVPGELLGVSQCLGRGARAVLTTEERPRQRAILTKKRRTPPRLTPTSGSGYAFPSPQPLFSAAEIHYNCIHYEHTPRGGGLAMVAGQSCIAGPSVFPPRAALDFSVRPYFPFDSMRNNKSPCSLCLRVGSA
jgi:hypothetical protein